MQKFLTFAEENGSEMQRNSAEKVQSLEQWAKREENQTIAYTKMMQNKLEEMKRSNSATVEMNKKKTQTHGRRKPSLE